MSEAQTELCGKCGAEIDFSRRVDFTLKSGSRVCEAHQLAPLTLSWSSQSSSLTTIAELIFWLSAVP
jgi:hypothetical protein